MIAIALGRKLETSVIHEYWHKTLNETLTDRIQYHIKKIIEYDQVRFILGMQDWINVRLATNFIHQFNKSKGKVINYYHRYWKSFDKIQYSFLIFISLRK